MVKIKEDLLFFLNPNLSLRLVLETNIETILKAIKGPTLDILKETLC